MGLRLSLAASAAACLAFSGCKSRDFNRSDAGVRSLDEEKVFPPAEAMDYDAEDGDAFDTEESDNAPL